MANLKALKQRIKTVKSTKKMTGAMKMVASSHLRRYQALLMPYRSYVSHITHMLGSAIPLRAMDEGLPPLLIPRPVKTHVIIVVASDRGLCGNFNVQLVHRTVQLANELRAKGQAVHVLPLSKKAAGFLSALRDITLRPVVPLLFQRLQDLINELAATLLAEFEAGAIDACSVVYMSYHSILSMAPAVYSLIPLHIEPPQAPLSPPLFGIDPDVPTFLHTASRLEVSSRLLWATLESKTSEEASRMMAMDNATRNANEMLAHLEILYNRTRQALITKELIEIISGAEAL